jgi:hypothetical protein
VDMDPERQETEAEAAAINREAQQAQLDAVEQRNGFDALEQQAEAQIDAIEQQAEAEEASQIRADDARQDARETRDTADDLYLARIHILESELRQLKTVALQPRRGFLRLFVRDLETNPHAQYKVHRWGMWWWVINFPLVTLLFFTEPSVWLKWGLYITLIYSIYANFSTDYGAMSAAMAAYNDRYLPPLPGTPFIGGMGGTGGRGGMGGAGGAGKNGAPGEPGKTGEPGELGEAGKGNAKGDQE